MAACQRMRVIILYIGNSQLFLYATHAKSYRLFIIQSIVLQAVWWILVNNEKAILALTCPILQHTGKPAISFMLFGFYDYSFPLLP